MQLQRVHEERFLALIVEADELDILSGQERLREYQFGTKVARHLFCDTCGIHPFYVPRSHPNGYSVNLRCLHEFETLVSEFEIKRFAGVRWEESIDDIR